MSHAPKIKHNMESWKKGLYIVIIVAAFITRLWALGERVQSHDESIHTLYSWNLYTGRGFQHQPLMHGPFLFHATALSYFLFGDNDFTARVPVALIGVAVVAFPWLLRRWLGWAGALAASFFLLISPSIAYYSRYIRHDIPIILWSLIVVWAIFSYLHDGRERWLYVTAAGVSLMFATKEVAFIYNAIIGLFLVALFAIRALGEKWSNDELKPLFLSALAAMAIGLLILGLGALVKQAEQPVVAWWAVAGGVLAGIALLVAMILLFTGVRRDLHDYRVFALIIVLGTLCLPFLSPVLIQIAGLDPLNYNLPTLYYSGAIAGAVIVLSAGIGLSWDWRRWGIAAAIHYAIFAVLFTTVFTNGTGIASGLVGSLGYWLVQQEVERGSQPWYYYAITVSLYEYLPLVLTFIASIYLALRLKLQAREEPRTRDSAPEAWDSRFLSFLLWWIVAAWISYSYAGEKMPWLTTHLALPMILLSGWLVGQLIESVGLAQSGVDRRQMFQSKAWLLAIVAPPFVASLAAFVKAARAGSFQGYELEQLNNTGRLLSGLAGTLAFGAASGYLIYRSGWRAAMRVLLLVALLVPVALTVRTAWRFCYVNYDYPIEHLVYAHAAPAVKETMRQIDELSRRTAGGPNLIEVSYGADGSTLWYWQLRNYPASYYGETPSREQMEAPVVIAGREQWDDVAPYMGNDYIVNTYTYLWWPMEDYRGLTWPRITHAITDTQTRAALWDIWYNRDYGRYDELTGEQHTLDAWPLRSDYRLYIRRDVAAQVWEYGMTEPIEIGPTDPYVEDWRELDARLVFGSQGTEPGQFERPNGIQIGPDGSIYIADTGNHRIQKFTADGQFVATWGRNSVAETETGSPMGFNEPWDIALASSDDSSVVDSIYVADTWNHRIQRLDAAGNPLRAWGLFGQYGPGDGAIGQSAFYGPRGVIVGPDGRVYVTDTGNKRVQVFEPDGAFAFQWGGGGVLDGYMDEPVGIAMGPDNAVYVADTWNRRVQVFDLNGVYLRQWAIAGWNAGLPDEKPYLAVDKNGYVYVTDPGYYRVLVFDNVGNYVLSFGQYGFDERSFALPTGIAVAGDGSIYVVDSHGARVLVFDALNLFTVAPAAEP
jgi:predicted membrane-bound mannosyltransferase/DNA-binding beta-propeller fold protein YncE